MFSIADEMALTDLPHHLFGRAQGQHGLLDRRSPTRDGRLVAQGLTLPGHLGSMPTALAAIMRHFGDDIGAGRRVHHERPVRRRHAPARHLHLQAALSRRRARSRSPCTVCHHTDVGGRVAGSNASDSTEIYAGGAAHPAAEALRARRAQRDLIDASSRRTCACRCKVFGDLRAQLAACHIAEQAVRRAGRRSTAPAQIERATCAS